MNRMRSRIKPEIVQEQCDFFKDTGTRNAIFIIRIISERAVQIQKDLHSCFRNDTKASI